MNIVVNGYRRSSNYIFKYDAEAYEHLFLENIHSPNFTVVSYSNLNNHIKFIINKERYKSSINISNKHHFLYFCNNIFFNNEEQDKILGYLSHYHLANKKLDKHFKYRNIKP
jgi:hypothetical protein